MSAPELLKHYRHKPCQQCKKQKLIKQGVGSESESDLMSIGMKRVGNLYKEICSIDNLILADSIARKGKSKQRSVQEHDMKRGCNIISLHNSMMENRYKTSVYETFVINDPKEREIHRLPYYPDRIVHHAIMNELERVFVARFTADTYSCIKGRGIHAALEAVKFGLKDVSNTTYCLKLDIRKFYPSVDHDVLKALLQRIFKDNQLLSLLDEIIDSAPGLPIGNYLSQYLANFYLSYFDHWLKEQKRVRYYYRYADDMVILAGSKEELHGLLADVRQYLHDRLKLTIKKNYQVFPVEKRGIDFVGYRIYHTHVLMRKSIKQNFARMMAVRPNALSLNSYRGWAKHANCFNLLKKLTSEKIQRNEYIRSGKRVYRE